MQSELTKAELAVSSMKATLGTGMQHARDTEERAEQRIKEVERQRDGKIAEVEEELRAAETVRRKLHNQVQELKGGWIWPGGKRC
jgi:kinesin family protein C1